MIEVPERRTPSKANCGPAGRVPDRNHAVADDVGDPELERRRPSSAGRGSPRAAAAPRASRGHRARGQEQDPEVVQVAGVVPEARHLVVGADRDRPRDAVPAVPVERDEDVAGRDPELGGRQAMPRGQEDVVGAAPRAAGVRARADRARPASMVPFPEKSKYMAPTPGCAVSAWPPQTAMRRTRAARSPGQPRDNATLLMKPPLIGGEGRPGGGRSLCPSRALNLGSAGEQERDHHDHGGQAGRAQRPEDDRLGRHTAARATGTAPRRGSGSTSTRRGRSWTLARVPGAGRPRRARRGRSQAGAGARAHATRG